MKVSILKHVDILRAIGLSGLEYYTKSEFQIYIDSDYPSSRKKEEEEFYRMHEYIIMHMAPGLRVTYFTIESYDRNQVEYLLGTPFIIANQTHTIAVDSIDLEIKVFQTAEWMINFDDVRKSVF